MPLAAHIRNRFTFGVAIVLAHYIAWRFGVFLIHRTHGVEGFAENFFFDTFYLRWYVLTGACAYSVLRRFALPKKEWDIYGPPLALLSSALMYLEIQKYV